MEEAARLRVEVVAKRRLGEAEEAIDHSPNPSQLLVPGIVSREQDWLRHAKFLVEARQRRERFSKLCGAQRRLWISRRAQFKRKGVGRRVNGLRRCVNIEDKRRGFC